MTEQPYDTLAPFYRHYAARRARYCDAVNRKILAWRPPSVDTMLDVGSGDGSRAARLARAVSVGTLVLSDPSRPMSEMCREHGAAQVWTCAAQDLPTASAPFDVVTCLWNVLGSIDCAEDRLQALKRMRMLVSPHGRVFIDVHNRYNVATAGLTRVIARRTRDRLRPSATNGVVCFAWDVEGRSIPSHGYLFTPSEMQVLFEEAGVRPVQTAFLDYDTGEARGRWTGQMLYALERV